jgi:signal peptidase I
VSDGWDWDRPDHADADEESPGGWPEEDVPAKGESGGGWPDEDRPPDGRQPGEDASSDWPAPAWEPQEHGGHASQEWEPADYAAYGSYGYAEQQAANDPESRSRDPLARLFPGLPHGVRVTLDWILTIAGAVAIVVLLKVFVVNPYRIPSSSMEPALNCAKPGAGCLGDSSDRVLACRICLRFRAPSRGDIVVFNTPKAAVAKCGEGGTFVKRVIGLPNETIHEDKHGNILVKSPGSPEFVKLKEPYLSASRRLADSEHFNMTWHVPANSYFMMGDNRSQSCDSRTWGAVPRKDLIGTVFFVYWPPDRIGFR